MSKAIRKLIRRLIFTVAILVAIFVEAILWTTPKLLTNIGGLALILFLLFHGVLGFCNSLNRRGTTWPDDEQMRSRQDRDW